MAIIAKMCKRLQFWIIFSQTYDTKSVHSEQATSLKYSMIPEPCLAGLTYPVMSNVCNHKSLYWSIPAQFDFLPKPVFEQFQQTL